MAKRNLFALVLTVITLPGTVIHELAHASTVWLIPGVRITELDLTSHVKHEGHYTITRTFLISYAPLLVNSLIALGCIRVLDQMSPLQSIESFSATMLLLYIGVSAGLMALPSFQDALSPLQMIRNQLFTRRIVFVLPLTPFFVLLSVPTLVISYLSRKSLVLQLLFSGVYVCGLLLVGFDIVTLGDIFEFGAGIGQRLIDVDRLRVRSFS